MNYGFRRGLYLSHLWGGSIGAGVLFATGHRSLSCLLLLAGVLGAVFLAVEEGWQSERDGER